MDLRAQISRSAVAAIVAHAREEAPSECCGLLLGAALTIAEAALEANIASNRYARFLIDPKDHIDIRRGARRRGVEVVGFYHSHPRSPAWPSPSDVAEATYPRQNYQIVTHTAEPPDNAIYRLEDRGGGNFLRLPVVTVG
jgi:proteasome lid subunit RPN8/RPN11